MAYKQPVTKGEMEQIRGVNCDYSVQKLLEKELITIKGKSESVGKPLLYVTSEKFMEYFGINDIAELPTPKEFVTEVNSIGENLDQSETMDQKERRPGAPAPPGLRRHQPRSKPGGGTG